MTWQENLRNFSFDNAQSIYRLGYLIFQSHVSDWLWCVPVATYTKKALPFINFIKKIFEKTW